MPFVCQTHPLRFNVDVTQSSVRIKVEKSSLSCHLGKKRRSVPEEDLTRLADKAVRMYIAGTRAGKKPDLNAFCQNAFILFENLSLEEAVQSVVGDVVNISVI